MNLLSEIRDIKVDSIHLKLNVEENKSTNKKLIFPKDSSRIALIYGRNGSGKSTIAHEFSKINNVGEQTNISFLDSSGQLLDDQESLVGAVSVFDENYINTRVKLIDEGLDTIVLIGNQVNVDKGIKKIEQELEIASDAKKRQEAINQQLDDEKDLKSHYFYKNKCINELKKRWAPSDSKIKGIGRNAGVNFKTVEQIKDNTTGKSKSDLEKTFDQRLKLYISSESALQTISEKILDVVIPNENIQEETKKLLSQIIQEPQLTDSEKKIKELFESELGALTSVKDFLSDEKITICETCLQPIEEVYRRDILKKIEHILNKKYETIKNKLLKFKLEEIDGGKYSKFKGIDDSKYNAVIADISHLNLSIIAHNNCIDQKINKPYEKVDYNCMSDILSSYQTLNEDLKLLEEKRLDYNSALDSRAKFKDELLLINNQIACKEIKNDYDIYDMLRKKRETAEEKWEELCSRENELNRKLSEEKNKMQNTKIGMDEINKSLSYIFYSKDRLCLEPGEDSLYHLKVNGKNVNPSKVSTGERNAIALSYFFTELSSGKKQKEMYTAPKFLIIDDPISSFDWGNRVGIMSLLRLQMGKIFLGNENTKCIIMTHDVSVMFDFQKCFKEISKICKSKSPASNSSFDISDGTIQSFSINNNVYTNAFKEIYSFAKKPTNTAEKTIGNTIRKVLEGFTTFSYKKGIDDVSYDTSILQLLSEDKREYYQGSMYRLVLNGESHLQESAQGNVENNFLSYFSLEEKKRTARDIISFIYLLNKMHVLCQLSENGNDQKIEDVIETWISQVKY